MRRRFEIGGICALTATALLAFAANARAQAAFDPAVAAAYDAFYRGDRAGADAQFHHIAARPNDLAGGFGQLVVTHARMGPDGAESPSFEQAIDGFIKRASDRYQYNQGDDDALFYLAFSYTLRSGYKFEHQKGLIGAARDGGHARGYADTYLKRHPDNGDVHLVRGLYNYFVDLAPSFVHIFRFLLFLPGGNRTTGLQDIEFAAAHGTYFARTAQLQLIPIYGALEGRAAEAVAFGERLQREFPANDDVAFALADVYISPGVEQRDRAGQVYEGVLERHRADATPDGAAARARASYGLAGARFDAWRCDEAMAILNRTIDAPANLPDWVLPRFLLRRAGYRMLLNDPGAAADAKRVRNDETMSRYHDDADDVLKAISKYQSQGDAALYAALIPANRLVVEGKYAEARQRYESIARGKTNEPQVRYRLAYMDFVRGDTATARPVFQDLTNAKNAPDWVRAAAYLYLGRLADLAGDRPTATKAYQKVVDDYSEERASLAARVGLITPYKRPPTQ